MEPISDADQKFFEARCHSVITTTTRPYIFFEQYLGEQDQVEMAFEMIDNLQVSPGVIDHLKSTSPPELTFFKQLPSMPGFNGPVGLKRSEDDNSKWICDGLSPNSEEFDWDPDNLGDGWGGYAVHGLAGLGRRGYVYQTVQQRGTAVKVLEALKDGYEITHIGVLYKHDIPHGDDEPLLRLLNKSMEAQLTFRFGGMHSKDKDYNMGHLVSFDLTQREYDGLCTHSALFDPNGYEGLDKKNASYLAEKIARKRKSDKDRQTRYKAKHADDPAFQAMKQKHMDDGHAKEKARGKYLPCKHAGCDTKWMSKKDMMRHYNAVHLNIRVPCWFVAIDECEQDFNDPQNMRKHFKTKHLEVYKGMVEDGEALDWVPEDLRKWSKGRI
ncbi:hypothetical protein BDZ85DRAFT_277648 [Elsinoe ampelina]|uniref:C2H2-type domain-containing protein n=1 Tax=Elsinoe ampelina TaxID=302913 RepID=A0A6A6GPZ1_9PEZI|nr:hypothetical protein BDZ85DRAFT_277648 [Elsinoe ampelina]